MVAAARWICRRFATLMMPPAIRTTQLRKEFDETIAVSNLGLEVGQGEVFGFLGPNGAGKTTAVKMLLGLIRPTSGGGTLLGQPLGHRRTRSQVGYLPEHFRFHAWLTAVELLELHGTLYGMSQSERSQVIPDLLELVDLAEQAHVRVGAFSKGMTQRVGLAQALLNNPRLVFLDEPTSGLDPIGRRLVRDIILDLRDEGVTVFLNSHMLSEVELTCDRVAFIRQGEVVETFEMDDLNRHHVRLTVRVGEITPALLTGVAQFGTLLPQRSERKAAGRLQLDLGSEDKIPLLVRWLVENGHSLFEVSPSRLTLEERFIQIMEHPS